MKAPPLLTLDFDGVICDSITECFQSSLAAYYGAEQRTPPAADLERIGGIFRAMRPFIRSGEDYVLLQRLIDLRVEVRSQEDFDARVRETGPSAMAAYRDEFYRARTELLSKDRGYWLSLNSIYPHMRTILVRPPRGASIRIVSTKKPQFIAEILAHEGLDFPPDRITDSGSGRKLSLVGRMLDDAPAAAAIFVDDQIDHLAGNRDGRIRPYLAAWGYVKPEWLAQRDVPVLTADGFRDLVESEYGV